MALPGVSLAPGTYIFRRPMGNVLLVTVLGTPLADGAPPRLEAWFAPGETNGQQLIYRATR